MSAVTSFKVAFLSRCAEEGLTLEQIHERVKTAVAKAEAKYGQVKEAGVGKGIAAGLGLGLPSAAAIWKAWPNIGTGFTSWLAGADPATAAAAGVMAPKEGEKGWTWPLVGLGLAGLAGTGLAAGKYLATSQEDPLAEEEIKNRELINEYKRLADRTRMAAKRRKLLEGKGGF